VLEKAKKYILSCQHDEEDGYNRDEHTRSFGGFFYGSSKHADLSNSGFSLEALNALGLEKDSPAWKNAIQFIKRCQDNDETNDSPEMKGGDNSGGMVYYPSKSEFGDYMSKAGKKRPKPYGNMTYMGVKSLIYAGMKQDDPAMQAAFKWIKSNYAVDHQPGAVGTEGYFYYCNVMAKAMSAAGIKELELSDGKKANWAKELSAAILKLQKPDGSFVNSAGRWMEGDPVLSTAYALDALNLCIEAMKK
jgi:squalene-hopene/tetraprenyl-beta-curcumene cyclase